MWRRFSRMIRSFIGFFISSAENPEIILEQNIRDLNDQVPRMNEIPEMHIDLIVTDNHPTGVGQMGTPMIGPAIANAMYRLTGVRLRESPMTPARVKKAVG